MQKQFDKEIKDLRVLQQSRPSSQLNNSSRIVTGQQEIKKGQPKADKQGVAPDVRHNEIQELKEKNAELLY